MIDSEKIIIRSTLNLDKKLNFGEVFTDKLLIEEMLDKLPSHVWNNPNLKWLDPAAGNGNFHASVFNRLFSGLKNVISGDKARRKHIIEKMLYFAEFQANSVRSIEEIFDPKGELSLNTYLGDFTTSKANEFSVSKFDIILGNPPYQKMHATDKRKAKNHNLWSSFVSKGFEYLNPGGFLLYITPPAWMSPSSNLLQDIFLKHQVHYINIGECSKWFPGIGSQFSYYLIEKTPTYKPTIFHYQFKGGTFIKSSSGFSTFKLSERVKFIPQLPTEEAFKIFEKTVFKSNQKLMVRYDSDLHKFTKRHLISDVRDDIFQYRILHTPTQEVWAIRPHKYQGIIKVFIPLTTYFESIIIDNCGQTQGLGYILCENHEEAEKTQKVLLSNLYRFIANVTRWSNFNVPLVMKSLPNYPLTNPIDNASIYKYFKLTKKEVDFIEKTLRPLRTQN